MKLSAALSPLEGVWFGITIALLPTLKALLRSPWLILSPRRISQIYMANQWLLYGDGVDGNGKEQKEKLITPHAYGRVLDLGAGHGHTVRYLDRSRVTQYIALEPNVLMHPFIRKQAKEHGYSEADHSLEILSCGAEEIDIILSKLSAASTGKPAKAGEASTSPHNVDTLISVMTLCTVPNPQKSITSLVHHVLKPGGHFLMYEHVLSPLPDVAWWQRFWASLWAFQFDGCRMDRQTDTLVRELTLPGKEGGYAESAWKNVVMWDEPEKDISSCFFFRTFGVFQRR